MIEIRSLSFRYREMPEPALRDVNLTFETGAFIGITGPAGCGKSTLSYALNGIIPHCYPGDFYGSVTIDGTDTVESALTDISRLVGSVCQDIDSQMVSPVVEDEILFGMENFGVPHDEIAQRLEETLADVGISELRRRNIASLSGGQKQKVALASILAMKPPVLMLDEPTAELDPASSIAVFELLARYAHEHGTTIVVIEQKIALLAQYATQLVVMEGGRIRFCDTPTKVIEHAEELLKLGVNVPRVASLARRLQKAGQYTGPLCRSVDEAYLMVKTLFDKTSASDLVKTNATDKHTAPVLAHVPSAADFSPNNGETPDKNPVAASPFAIEFRKVCASYGNEAPVLHKLSFGVREGEFVAFLGTNGAGKSTAMRLINGLLRPSEGEVLVRGKSTKELSTSTLAATVGFLFQNPDRQICCSTVRDEMLFGFKALGTCNTQAQKRVDDIMAKFKLDPKADPFLLNRGSRQLLALACIVALRPPILVLDEPTSGLDFRECETIMHAVRELNQAGTTVIMVCHDMEVVADFAERVVVMHGGSVIDYGPTFEVLRNRETLKAASLEPPQIAALSLKLAEHCPDLRKSAIMTAALVANTLDEMSAALMHTKEA